MSRNFYLYNTLTRRKEILEPRREDNTLRIYARGPIVYSYVHIGNFRAFLTTDLIIRTAHASGLLIKYVCNIGDIGEFLQKESEFQKSHHTFPNIWDLAQFYTKAFLKDWKRLHLIEPDVRPRSSEHVTDQIHQIQKLIEKGYAYETELGVYFDITSFPRYGLLSGNTLKNLKGCGRNIKHDPAKRHIQDFVLWKKNKDHFMCWHSPYGWGYPGWHIECSAMASKYLGDTLDLHTGGRGNIFPHHECEIAQGESITGKVFAKHWVHTAPLLIGNIAMAKNKGNTYTLTQLMQEGFSPFAIRYALTSTRYNKPLYFSKESLKAAERVLSRLNNVYNLVASISGRKGEEIYPTPVFLHDNYQKILEAMQDDLNMPLAYAHLLKGVKYLEAMSRTLSPIEGAYGWFSKVKKLLGIACSFSRRNPQKSSSYAVIEKLLEERTILRAQKDYEASDKIREKLKNAGITIRDRLEGTEWKCE